MDGGHRSGCRYTGVATCVVEAQQGGLALIGHPFRTDDAREGLYSMQYVLDVTA